jgi:transposase, IS5 family
MEDDMGFKSFSKNLSFSDLEITNSIKHNRSVSTLEAIHSSINWKSISDILLSEYKPGSKNEGADAYPPILLFKCLLLQKWFRIPSDPELETQINDRISFKRFLQLPLGNQSPDHSTFSRFRGRLSKDVMDKINTEILRQFDSQGLSINEGIAVDARLVKSSSRPISNDKIKSLKKEKELPENRLDKKGRPIKFSRDLDSDWTIKNGEPHYGLKEHASVDINNGFILATTLTPSSVNDSQYLPYCTIHSLHTEKPVQEVLADKGYAGAPNRSFLSLNHIKDGIMGKNTTTARLTDYEKERNRNISKSRYVVEQYFGISHLHDAASRARFPKMIKNKIDCWLRQAAYNLRKGLRKLEVLAC